MNNVAERVPEKTPVLDNAIDGLNVKWIKRKNMTLTHVCNMSQNFYNFLIFDLFLKKQNQHITPVKHEQITQKLKFPSVPV